MVWMDMDMPACCEDCDFIAIFDKRHLGCVLTVEDNGYGMELIRKPNQRLESCPIHPLDDEVRELIEDRFKELHVLRDDIDIQLETLEQYIIERTTHD